MRTILAFLLLAFAVGWTALHSQKVWDAMLHMLSGAALDDGDKTLMTGIAVLAIFAIIIRRR